MAQLEKEQGNLSVYHDKQAKATSAIAGLEVDLANAQEALVAKEHSRQDAMADKKLLEQECTAVKKDIEDVEMAIQKIEQEKTNRDHTIRSLNDEIANQDEVINKLNKEKKHISENAAKSAEDLGAAEVSAGASYINNQRKARLGNAKRVLQMREPRKQQYKSDSHNFVAGQGGSPEPDQEQAGIYSG